MGNAVSSESDEEGLGGGNTDQQQRHHPCVNYPVAACRQLSAFPTSPQVECLVGPECISYKYNAVIMASRSLFIDALLASPITAARRRRCAGHDDEEEGKNTKNHDDDDNDYNEADARDVTQIDFSDIPERTWIKMMTILEPGGLISPPGAHGTNFFQIREMKDIVEVLRYYEQYQFLDGVHLCDVLLTSEYKRSLECREASRFVNDRVIGTALRYSIQLDLPLSKPSAITLAKKLLEALLISDRSDIEFIFRYFLNDGHTDISPILRSVFGESRSMRAKLFPQNAPINAGATSMTGKRKRSSDEDEGVKVDFDFFWEQYKIRSSIVAEMDNAHTFRPLPVVHVRSTSEHGFSTGQAPLIGTGHYHPTKTKDGQRIHNPRLERRGAMSNVWILHPNKCDAKNNNSAMNSAIRQCDERPVTAILLRATDFTGRTWEIASYTFIVSDAYTFEIIIPTTTETLDRCTKVVLYQNKSSTGHSLPPRLDWVSAKDSSQRIEVLLSAR